VAADPEGRVWGRLEPRHFAALDPASGELLALPRASGRLDLAFSMTPYGPIDPAQERPC